MAKKEQMYWEGHPVRDEEHRRELDLKAAVYQFHHGMDRAAAEKRTKYEDQVERHQKAAAHHLDGMRAAAAVGNHDDSEKHHAMYSLHLKALGHDPMGAVPPEIGRWKDDKEKKHAYTFRGSPDDQFLVQHVRNAPQSSDQLKKGEVVSLAGARANRDLQSKAAQSMADSQRLKQENAKSVAQGATNQANYINAMYAGHATKEQVSALPAKEVWKYLTSIGLPHPDSFKGMGGKNAYYVYSAVQNIRAGKPGSHEALVSNFRDQGQLKGYSLQHLPAKLRMGLAKAEGDKPKFGSDWRDPPGTVPGELNPDTSEPCPNCGRQISPIEKYNDYCSGCAKDLKDALAYRAETPFPATDEEHEANMQRLIGSIQEAGPHSSAAKQRLVDYLRQLGIQGAQVEDVVESHPTPQQPPLRVFENPNPKLSAPRYGHLRVVKAEEWPFILSTWRNLAKADGGAKAQGRVTQFDVRKSYLRHRHMPEAKAFDYSSWLTPEQRQNGYSMFTLSHGPGNPVRVHVVHNNQKAGSAVGNVDQGDLEVENYNLNGGAHNNRGLEASMLNALMGHAKSHMGANYLSHGPFTPEASALLEAIAKPHGLELGDPEDIVEGETPVDQPPGRAVTSGVKVRSNQPQRVPRSFLPRGTGWWQSAAEQGDF